MENEMNRYEIKADNRCLFVHDNTASMDLDLDQIVALLHDRDKKVKQLAKMVEYILTVKDHNKFFDKIPQAKKRSKLLDESTKAILSILK